MAISIGTAANVGDLLTAVTNFAGTKGWNVRQQDTTGGKFFLDDAPNLTTTSGNYTWASFRYDTGTPQYVGIFQSLGFSGGATSPGNHTDDSGQGTISGTNATIAQGRHVKLVNSTMPYWIFSGLGTAKYIHVFVQVAAGTIVSFGFGTVSKFGDGWTGGQYAFGHHYNAVGAASAAVDNHSSYLLDALADLNAGGTDALGGSPFRASLHMEGITNQNSPSKWAVVGNFATILGLNDRAGHARSLVAGGFRGGPSARSFGRWGSDTQVGNVPLTPIPVAALVPDSTKLDLYFLGYMPDVFGVNIQFFELGNVIRIGSDDYYIFPTYLKHGDDVAGSGAGTSYWSGIAHRLYRGD